MSDPYFCTSINDQTNVHDEHIDAQINNIIQDIRTNTITESVFETMCIIDKSLLTKYYVSDIMDITDFIDGTYYDYLTTIEPDTWAQYKRSLVQKIGRLEISDHRVLKLFMDKLSITHNVLFTKVKENPHNQPLVMCCICAFNNEFVKTISVSDKEFFTSVIKNGDLEYNKSLYHNVYCKIKHVFGKHCIYEYFFPRKNIIGYKYKHIRNYDVFEYFVKLFGTIVREHLKIAESINYVITTCYPSENIFYEHRLWKPMIKTYPIPNICVILGRLVDLTKTSMTDVKKFINENIMGRYNKPLCHIRFSVHFDHTYQLIVKLIQTNRIDELIEIFDYVGIDLKEYNPNVIVYMLIDVIFSNDRDSITKFIRYLKNVVRYKINTGVYSRVIGLLEKTDNRYKYLATYHCKSLSHDVVEGLNRLKYGGSVIKFVPC